MISGGNMKNLFWILMFVLWVSPVNAGNLSGDDGEADSSRGIAATNIHVSVDGSDETGDGSAENPYATITKAAGDAQPGDTVFVHQGTYHNENFGDGDIWKKDKMATITCNGTADAWIVFMPFPGDSVLLEFDANGIQIKGAYVQFSGFEVKAMADQITLDEALDAWGLYMDSLGVVHDLAEEMGIDIRDPSLWGQTLPKDIQGNILKPPYYNGHGVVASKTHHVVIKNNVIHDICASAVRNQGGDYVSITGNELYYNTYWTSVGVGALTVAEATVRPDGDTFTGIKIRIEQNRVHHSENRLVSWNPNKDFIHFVIDEGSGIFMTRNSDTYDHGYILIANNLSYFNGASGIVVHKTDRTIVEHNTVYLNGTTNGDDAKPGGIGFNTTDSVTIRNNIAWSRPNKFALGVVGNPNTNLTVDSNIVFNDYGPENVVKGVESGWREEDPLLVDPENFDFHLTAESPAIDNGDTDIVVTTDIDGFPRDDGKPDIGAYEYDPTVSVNETLKTETPELRVYPNPATGKVFVQCFSGDLNTLKIYDLTGKICPVAFRRTGEKSLELDLSGLLPGFYLLRTNSATVKILKQ